MYTDNIMHSSYCVLGLRDETLAVIIIASLNSGFNTSRRFVNNINN